MGQRPADRAPVADLEVADQGHGPGEQRHRLRLGGVLDRRLTGHGADMEPSLIPSDALQVGDAVEVDEVGEAGQPQGQQRNEALTPRERLGLVAVLTEDGDRVGNSLGRVVRERRWFHPFLPS